MKCQVRDRQKGPPQEHDGNRISLKPAELQASFSNEGTYIIFNFRSFFILAVPQVLMLMLMGASHGLCGFPHPSPDQNQSWTAKTIPQELSCRFASSMGSQFFFLWDCNHSLYSIHTIGNQSRSTFNVFKHLIGALKIDMTMFEVYRDVMDFWTLNEL